MKGDNMTKIGLLAGTMILTLAAAVVADDIAVTVYNSNLGVVSETRRLEFEKGAGKLAFRDVPAQIDASSVRFELVETGRKVNILEQNYAYDLVSPNKIYDRYLDQRIELIDKEGRLFSGKLLAFNGGAVTLMEESGKIKIISMQNVTETNFPVLPEGLITRPTLFWLYQSDYSGEVNCRVGYQTGGLSWTAEYVGLLNDSDTELGLNGWASISNTSGKSYREAALKLVAGDINRAAPPTRRYPAPDMLAMAEAKGGFEEKAFFEYHLYTLPRKTTLADNEIKQVSLFDPAATAVKKVYLYQPDQNSTDVQVKVEFKNSRETGLGMPLPAGRVRVFKTDTDGSMILVGEDRIDHTPKDEDMSLAIGNAFDLAATTKTVEQTRISKQVEERTEEIELRNRKDEDVTIKVEKNLWGYWEILESSLPYEKKDANTVVFQVPVKANQTVTLRLKVRYTNG